MGRENKLNDLVTSQIEEILAKDEQISRRELLKRVRLAGLGTGIVTSLVVALILNNPDVSVPTDEQRVAALLNKIKNKGEVLEYLPGEYGIAGEYRDNPLPTYNPIRFDNQRPEFTAVNPLILRTFIPATGDTGDMLSLDLAFFNPTSGRLSFAPYSLVQYHSSNEFESELHTKLKVTQTKVESFQENTADGPRLFCNTINNSTVFEVAFVQN